MKTYLNFRNLIVIAVGIILLGCAQKREKSAASEEAQGMMAPPPPMTENAKFDVAEPTENDETPQQQTPDNQQQKPNIEKNIKGGIGTKDTLSDIKLPKKKFIKTAELRGKVANTIQLTEITEDIIKSYGGFITQAKLQNSTHYTNTVVISSDSLLHINHVVPYATLNVAVPHQHLDSALRKIARLLAVVEERKVSAEDVSISLLEERMKATVNQQSKVRLQKATQEAGSRLDRIVEAEEAMVNRQLEVINSQVTNLRTNDRIAYSSITIEVTQPEIVKQYTTLNTNKSLASPFWYRLKEAFVNGWEMCQQFILFVINGWAAWLFIFAIFLLYSRFIRPYFKNRKTNTVADKKVE
jgi:hypothetical protein